jgi:ABC-type multidrug transport system permease subunit
MATEKPLESSAPVEEIRSGRTAAGVDAAPAPAGKYYALVELTRARILEFIREPEAVFWVFVFPVLLALALGIAFRSKPVGRAQVAILASSTVATGQGDSLSHVLSSLEHAGSLEVHLLSPQEAAYALRKGKVDVIVDLSRIFTSPPGDVTYRYDETRTEGRAARLAVDDALQRALGRKDAVAATEEPIASPGSRYIDFLIPGLVGLNLMGSGLWGIGFSIVVTRTRKLLKRFAATPMRRSHYLLSFALSRLLFLALEVAAVVGCGWLIFDVKVHGSLVDLAIVALLGAVCFAGLGLLIAARPKTVEAVSGWMNLVMLPMWLLSGTFFSYERFPQAVQPAIRALPLTALNDALRIVINDGFSLTAAWSQSLILLAWGAVTFMIAVRVFRWQ